MLHHPSHYKIPFIPILDTGEHIPKTANGILHPYFGPKLLSRLHMAANSTGPGILSLISDQIGLHSTRSGVVGIAMCLAVITVFCAHHNVTRTMVWFSTDISSKMILNKDFTVPLASKDDPRTQNHPLNLTSQNNTGLYFKDSIIPLIIIYL